MKTNKVDKPTEEEIISSLENFKPIPSDRFYQRMQSAQWQRVERPKITLFPALMKQFQSRRWQSLALLAVMIMLIAALIVSTPSARVVAQKIVQYFIPAQSDAIALQITDTLPISLGTSVPVGHFSLDLSQVEALTDYQLKEIPHTKSDLTFSGAYHDPTLGAVALRYDGAGFTLILSQRPTGSIKEYASIGATAPVQSIRIHGIPGEYVEGGWRVEDRGTNKYPTIVPEETVTLGIYWDPELPQRLLRWQEADMIYEILAIGNNTPSKEYLLGIAESLN